MDLNKNTDSEAVQNFDEVVDETPLSEIARLNDTLASLAGLMQNINSNLNLNREIMRKIDNKISVPGMLPESTTTSSNVNMSDKVGKQNIPGASQQNLQSVSGKSDRAYISAWKDLGGNNLHFSPGGTVHPVTFIKKLKILFEDAEVPQNKRVNLAINALKGSSQNWAQTKEDTFWSFDVFERKFLDRYWGTSQERELYQKIKFGMYQAGSKADYFLKLLAESKYLSMQISEAEIVKMVVSHFNTEIKKGVVCAGLVNADEVEAYLREVDELSVGEATRTNTASQDNRSDRNPDRNWRYNNRNTGNSERPPRRGESNQVREEASRGPNERDDRATVAVLLDNYEGLLEEEPQEVKQLAVAPTIEINVESVAVRALVDSGSQLTCISRNFFNKLKQINMHLPILPASCSTLIGALGDKSQKVREQVYLQFSINNWSFDYTCIIVPKLVRDIILGCDWMQDFSVNINFKNQQISGCFQGCTEIINFIAEPTLLTPVIVSELCAEEEGVQTLTTLEHNYSREEMLEVASRAESFDDIHKNKLGELLIQYEHVFSNKPGRTDIYIHEIILHDYTPFNIKSYPVPLVYREEVKRQLNEMKRWGIIEEASTEYVSPLVVVAKKG